ncbi:hypothetical protein HOV93_33100 [Planctomycetes bacterium FF15]|uniref:Uncharacterized protein n=1 Tax=Bremerella alba TaxID=980252 RepID=A0A7V9A8J8_9BACT|nr:hypothetical protein [Bremerella alba]
MVNSKVPFAADIAGRVGIWTLILILPLQSIFAGGQACMAATTLGCGESNGCQCCLEQRQGKTCCCQGSASKTHGNCCHASNTNAVECSCGIACPCGHATPVESPAIPTRDSDARADIVSWAFTVNPIDTVTQIKFPLQGLRLQLAAIQAVSVDRCSTLCRFTL